MVMQETSEHTSSYYAATALHLAERGYDVFERVRHWKLPGGKWFANPALAPGMLYYRWKEII
jgi:hypothetical protein